MSIQTSTVPNPSTSFAGYSNGSSGTNGSASVSGYFRFQGVQYPSTGWWKAVRGCYWGVSNVISSSAVGTKTNGWVTLAANNGVEGGTFAAAGVDDSGNQFGVEFNYVNNTISPQGLVGHGGDGYGFQGKSQNSFLPFDFLTVFGVTPSGMRQIWTCMPGQRAKKVAENSAQSIITFTNNPVAGDTIGIGTDTWTFVSGTAGAGQIAIGASITATLQNAYIQLASNSITSTPTISNTYAAVGSSFYISAKHPWPSNSTMAITCSTSGATVSANPMALSTFGNVTPNPASSACNFIVNPSNNNTITLNTVTWKFVTSGATGTQTNIQGSVSATVTQLVADLTAYATANPSSDVALCTYTAGGSAITVTSAAAWPANIDFVVSTTVAASSFTYFSLWSPENFLASQTSTAFATGAFDNLMAGYGFPSATQIEAIANGVDPSTQHYGVAPYGVIRFVANPSNTHTISLSGVTWTFVTSGATGNQTNIQATLSATLAQLVSDLNASANVSLTPAIYSTLGNKLIITYKTVNSTGLSYTLSSGQANAVAPAVGHLHEMLYWMPLATTAGADLIDKIRPAQILKIPNSGTTLATYTASNGLPTLTPTTATTNAVRHDGFIGFEVFQQVGGTCTAPVTCSYQGADGVIQYQLIKEADGSVYQAWANLATGSGGTASGTITWAVTQAWLQLQLRKTIGGVPQSDVTTDPVAFIGGEVAVQTGQSQSYFASGLLDAQHTALGSVSQYACFYYEAYFGWATWKRIAASGWNPAAATLANDICLAGVGGFGFTFHWAGGSDIKNWNGTLSNADWQTDYGKGRIQRIRQIGHVLWNQGSGSLIGSNYYVELTNLHNEFRTDLAAQGSWTFYVAPLNQEWLNADVDTQVYATRGSQLQWVLDRIANPVSGKPVALDAVLNDIVLLDGNDTHPAQAGVIMWRHRTAQSILKKMGVASFGATGPIITGATKAGTKIRLHIAQDGGTGFQTATAYNANMGSAAFGNSWTGLRVATGVDVNGVCDKTKLLTIASTGFDTDGTPIATLSADPGNVALYFDYQWGAPGNTETGTLTNYYTAAIAQGVGNPLYDNTTVGGPSSGSGIGQPVRFTLSALPVASTPQSPFRIGFL